MTDSILKLAFGWWIANLSAFLVAHLLYSVIGHGFTGHHGDELTVAQYGMHTLGLAVVSLAVLFAQRHVLSTHLSVSWRKISLGVFAYVGAFWLGYETFGPPADWFFGFTVLAVWAWFGLSGASLRVVAASFAAIAGFWIGMISVLAIAGYLIENGQIDPNVPTTMRTHTEQWLFIAGVSSLIGAGLSALPVSWLVMQRSIRPSRL